MNELRESSDTSIHITVQIEKQTDIKPNKFMIYYLLKRTIEVFARDESYIGGTLYIKVSRARKNNTRIQHTVLLCKLVFFLL